MTSKIPVLVLAFNRADHVVEAMKAIRDYKPEKLYLECDGARTKKEGEKEAVEATRKALLDAVDWPCEVKTLFRNENLGCANAVYGAITWFFEQEEFGIICEDDIILSPDFFKLCEDLLPRYRGKEEIMQIIAQNHSYRTDINNSYVYSFRGHCWGWASWARAWKKMDMTMSSVPSLSCIFLIKRLGLFEGLFMTRSYRLAYKLMKENRFNSWAARWNLSILINNGLVIIPGANLAVNIGMDGGAHYEKGDKNPYYSLKLGNIKWPLVYNDSFTIDRFQSSKDAADFKRIRIVGLKKRIRRLLKF